MEAMSYVKYLSVPVDGISYQIKYHTDRNNITWFEGNLVATAMGFQDTAEIIQTHIAEEDKKTLSELLKPSSSSSLFLSLYINMHAVNILRWISTKPAATLVFNWIYEDIIRHTVGDVSAYPTVMSKDPGCQHVLRIYSRPWGGNYRKFVFVRPQLRSLRQSIEKYISNPLWKLELAVNRMPAPQSLLIVLKEMFQRENIRYSAGSNYIITAYPNVADDIKNLIKKSGKGIVVEGEVS